MKAVITRVAEAQVLINNKIYAEIGPGILALIAIVRGDSKMSADRLLERIIGYRIFPDTQDRMQHSLASQGGELLLVPQFTLAANTDKGMKADFSPAATPPEAKILFDYLLTQARTRCDHPKNGQAGLTKVAGGKFGAMMDLRSVNVGPVTFILATG